MKTLKFFLTLSLILLVFSSIGLTQKKPDYVTVHVTISDLPLNSVTNATLTISGNGAFTPVVSTIYLNPLVSSDFTFYEVV